MTTAAAPLPREEPLLFGAAAGGEPLLGILHRPAVPSPLALLVVVGGPQYRAGSHRQFVLLARAVAAAGHAVLRFDVRGMGDSAGAPRGFEDSGDDIGRAIDVLHERLPGLRGVALWGLCDGASAALLYCERTQDPRVLGLCALNPWVRSEASLARTQLKHYYTQRLLQPAFWRKLLGGGVARGAVAEFWSKFRSASAARAASAATQPQASYQQRMATAWQRLRGRLLLVLSGRDYTAREFGEYVAADAAWRGALAQAVCRVHHVPEADHTFSATPQREAVERLLTPWLDELAADVSMRSTA